MPGKCSGGAGTLTESDLKRVIRPQAVAKEELGVDGIINWKGQVISQRGPSACPRARMSKGSQAGNFKSGEALATGEVG